MCAPLRLFLQTPEEERKRLLSFVVCGGGPTGVEVAAEMHDMIFDDLKVRRAWCALPIGAVGALTLCMLCTYRCGHVSVQCCTPGAKETVSISCPQFQTPVEGRSASLAG
jgi:hypothetical protein